MVCLYGSDMPVHKGCSPSTISVHSALAAEPPLALKRCAKSALTVIACKSHTQQCSLVPHGHVCGGQMLASLLSLCQCAGVHKCNLWQQQTPALLPILLAWWVQAGSSSGVMLQHTESNWAVCLQLCRITG